MGIFFKEANDIKMDKNLQETIKTLKENQEIWTDDFPHGIIKHHGELYVCLNNFNIKDK